MAKSNAKPAEDREDEEGSSSAALIAAGLALQKRVAQGKWIYLVSSNLAYIKWNPGDETLFVEFRSGSIYSYDNVPQEIVESLLAAVSHGSYFYYNIRTSFPYTRLV